MRSTPAGDELKTQKKVKAQFALPELQDKRLMEWDLHVAEDMGAHDMIMDWMHCPSLRLTSSSLNR